MVARATVHWVVGFWLPVGLTACLPLLSRVRMLDGSTMALGADPALPFVSVSRYVSAAPAAGVWSLLMGGSMGLAWCDVARPVRADRLCASLAWTHASLAALLVVPEAISPWKHQGLSGVLMTGATWYVYEAHRRYGGCGLHAALLVCVASALLLGAMNVLFHATPTTVGHAYFATEAMLVGACTAVAPTVVGSALRV